MDASERLRDELLGNWESGGERKYRTTAVVAGAKLCVAHKHVRLCSRVWTARNPEMAASTQMPVGFRCADLRVGGPAWTFGEAYESISEGSSFLNCSKIKCQRSK